MKTIIDMPFGAGPCVKQTVVALVRGRSGTRYVATNYTLNPQSVCPRADMPTGVGYHLCKEVCNQPAHAEIDALRLAGDDAKGATMLIHGHTYACDHCKRKADEAGIENINFV